MSLILLCFFSSSCIRKYKETEKLCNDNIYLEVFDRYPDCKDYYLTDSNKFRTFFLHKTRSMNGLNMTAKTIQFF